MRLSLDDLELCRRMDCSGRHEMSNTGDNFKPVNPPAGGVIDEIAEAAIRLA